MYLKTKDIQNMETKTEASKVWKPIMQINRYTAEQLEQEIKNRNLRRKLMLNSLKVKGYDLVVDSTRRIWELVDASEEIIGDRLDVLREMYEADLKMSASERLERNKGLDFYNFERNLALEVIKKAGVDTKYERMMRSFNKYKQNHDVEVSEDRFPKKNVPENVELKTDEEITNFIRGRLKAFYARKFDYPKEKESETELPKEKKVETIGA